MQTILLLLNAIRTSLPKNPIGWHILLFEIAFFLWALMSVAKELLEYFRMLFGG